VGGRHRTHAGEQARGEKGFSGLTRRASPARAVVVGAVLLVLGAGTATALAARTGVLGCLGSQTPLTVVASPDIAPALQQVAERFTDGEFGASGRCVAVTVTARDAQQVAEGLDGSQLAAATAAPDVWVPDSSWWLDQAGQARRTAQLRAVASVAHTPVVVALTRPLADKLDWQRARLSWLDLVKRADPRAGQSAVRMGLVDPNRSTASLFGLVALGRATAKAPNGQSVLLGTLRAVSSRTAATERSLLDQLPRTRSEVADPARPKLQAFPFTEQGVWRYNSNGPGVPLAAVYPADGAPRLDYPYVLSPAVSGDGDRARAAQDFLRALQAPKGQETLQGQAFRTTDGVAGPTVSTGNGLRQERPAAFRPRETDMQRLLQVWTVVNLNARMLAVIDASGSMLKVDPGVPRSRIALTREGAAQGLQLLSSESEVGLWVFSTNLTSVTDHVQVLDVGALGEIVAGSTRREVLKARLGGIAAKPNGGTGLYDTALAAYGKMVTTYDPRALNSVVLFTDGKNEDPVSISLPQLLAELKRLRDPRKPVPIYTIGFGTGVDRPALAAISAATGGQTYVTTDPKAMNQVFLQALAQRL
jgi:hypothetical protein